MTIEWTAHKGDDPDHHWHLFRATANGKSVLVQVSYEAVDDRDMDRIRRVAEAKIRKTTVSGRAPRKVQVTNADFAG